ncbi:MAG TPA: hypothetical protein VLH86_00550 [Patescibacteria group bacterium]|nr:hypothetical protein [Patescibacteria group bacterium]
MSEFIRRHERALTLTSYAALAGTVAVIGVLGASEIFKTGPIYDHKYPKTGIVRGVPMQVERHGPLPEAGRRQIPHYDLRVEQCPADVSAAQAGHPVESFNPGLDMYNPGCVDTWIRVDAATYQSHPDGSTLVLAGAVGDAVRKP